LTTITLLQKINPRYEAVLLKLQPVSDAKTDAKTNANANTNTNTNADVHFSAMSWNTTFADPARQAYHQGKMQSKVSRPAAQLQALGISAGVVRHEVDAREDYF
jgi:hypothetical protein